MDEIDVHYYLNTKAGTQKRAVRLFTAFKIWQTRKRQSYFVKKKIESLIAHYI